MAEEGPEILTREDKIAQAKEHYARGYRNYVVGDFNEAADGLSRSCELFAELYGDESEEVAVPNLFYGKTLIEIAQEENKVMGLPDQEDDEDEDDDDDDDDDKEDGNVQKSSSSSQGGSSSEPQPGPSSGIRNGGSSGGNDGTDEDNGEVNESLQFAWEALEMAARIFRRLGKGHEEYLAEAHYGLGEILMENQNCTEAVNDYNRAFEIFSKIEPTKIRCLAEIKYKTGLCHYTTMAYDASIKDFDKSAEFMKQAIEAQKEQDQTPDVEQTIEDLTKMREDILNKIVEVQETKDMIKSNLLSKGSVIEGAISEEDEKPNDLASSSANHSEKPKANDISHLIKRKKPDGPSCSPDVSSPAKKAAN